MTSSIKPIRKEMDELAVQLLTDFWLTTIKGFVDAAGETKAYQTTRPYLRPYGMSVALELGNPKIDEHNPLLDLLRILMVSNGSIGMRYSNIEIKSKGACGEIVFCPVIDSPGIICSFHEEIARGACLVKTPHLDIRIIQTIIGGQPTCRWVIHSKEDKYEKVCKSESTASMLPAELPESMMRALAMRFLTENWTLVLTAMLDALGEEKTEFVLATRFRRIGESIAPRLLEIQGLGSKGGHQAVVEAIDTFNTVLHQKGEMIVTGESSTGKVLSSCPFVHSGGLTCHLLHSVLKGICQTIDPSSDVKITRLECKNSVFCHWMVVSKI